VFVLKSGLEIVRRQGVDLRLIGESLLVEMSTNSFTKNPLKSNLSKVAIQVMIAYYISGL
jgi:hypothetical protein